MKKKLQDATICIVDDSEIFLKILKHKLHDLGCTSIIKCLQWELVENFLKQYSINCIIMDTHMPGKFGYDLCKKIKENPDYKEVIIIGMSDMDYEENWINNGADDFVLKKIIETDAAQLEKRLIDLMP